MEDKKREYTCDNCGGIFEYCDDKEWSREDVLTEMKDNFGELPEDGRAIICDDCFKKLTGAY